MMVDIVEQHFGAGVRLGESIANDMIAVRIGPDNGFPQIIKATLAGLGLACTLEEAVQAHIDARRLVRVLEDWCPVFPGYHL